jgi:muramidase (phage lysozyme)
MSALRSRLPEDFLSVLPTPKTAAHDKPLYYLWVHDPQEDKVHVEHNHKKHRADHITHAELADRIPHPERTHGYAYRILGGWRITDWEHHPVDDPHITRLVREALRSEA